MIQTMNADSLFHRFLRTQHAAWITHGLLFTLSLCFFCMVIFVPFWIAFPFCVVIVHRIGVLLHEYFHGIPFRRYRNDLIIVATFDALLLMFGMLELFRATHLAHHRWLNTENDSAHESEERSKSRNLLQMIASTEAVQHFVYLRDALSGRKPYVSAKRLLLGVILSASAILFWQQIGRPDVIWKIITINLFTTLIPVSLRGAIEHHGKPDDPKFANEYRVWIPLFNLNRHIHHHENPTLPWYLLEFRTKNPLPNWNYFSYWFHVYIRGDFVLMKPKQRRAG
jgi:fatty acid desaturase